MFSALGKTCIVSYVEVWGNMQMKEKEGPIGLAGGRIRSYRFKSGLNLYKKKLKNFSASFTLRNGLKA